MVAEKLGEGGLPWVEKYRPSSLEELISHQDIISTIGRFIDEGRLPHLLLYGPPGTGKTSTILACAKRLYTAAHFRSMVLELNASDDRGIGVVREQIQSFCSTKGILANGVKLVILDEADAMTKDAQNALRRIIEKYTDHVRFCLICNYLSRIIPALQSRCTRFRFAPLNPDQILPRLRHVIQEETLNVSDDGEKALLSLAHGDMRRVLNILQSTAMAFDEVTEENVYSCVGHPSSRDISRILDWLLNETFTDCFSKISCLKLEKGLALQDMLMELHVFVHRLDIPSHVQVVILEKMADIEHRLASGSSEKIQLGALIAAFQFGRQLICNAAEADH